ncbi:MAG: hypothetical protein H7833_20270 [Magnetococcus sp. DMHC-1]
MSRMENAHDRYAIMARDIKNQDIVEILDVPFPNLCKLLILHGQWGTYQRIESHFIETYFRICEEPFGDNETGIFRQIDKMFNDVTSRSFVLVDF